LCLLPPEAPPTSSASATKSSTPGAVSIIPGPRRPLGVGGSCSRRSHFSAGVDGTIAAAFCVEQRLCFSLSFFELGFICSGFVHIFGLNSFGSFERNRLGRKRNYIGVIGRGGNLLRRLDVFAGRMSLFLELVERRVFLQLFNV